ncbi:MAG TPA: hypothetical protein VNN74_03030 [Candidatus Micrarchaeia archaeon]|nr:hypothetical protein [Candidatus Micrarchaeia archaeon]
MDPSAVRLVAAAASAMSRAPAHELLGSARAGPAVVRFVVTVIPGGAFAGSVEATAPRMGTLRSDVIAVRGRVFVRSPMELARLGITHLPGHRDPARTWVLQPARIAAQYRGNVAPFTGAGLGQTLRRYFRHARIAGRCRVGAVRAFKLVAGGGGMRAVVYVGAVTHDVLRLAVTGAEPVVLAFRDFGHAGRVAAPPTAVTYTPPQLAPGT